MRSLRPQVDVNWKASPSDAEERTPSRETARVLPLTGSHSRQVPCEGTHEDTQHRGSASDSSSPAPLLGISGMQGAETDPAPP